MCADFVAKCPIDIDSSQYAETFGLECLCNLVDGLIAWQVHSDFKAQLIAHLRVQVFRLAHQTSYSTRKQRLGDIRIATKPVASSALSFCFVIIVPLVANDEPNFSLIQTTPLVQLLLAANT
jgi:hypothetical protein